MTLTAANSDATKRPAAEDIFNAAEGTLSLATQLALLFGAGATGIGGKKVIDWIGLAREKNKALKEIVQGNELFRRNSTVDNWDEFKKQQRRNQSPSTERLVTEIKSSEIRYPPMPTVEPSKG